MPFLLFGFSELVDTLSLADKGERFHPITEIVEKMYLKLLVFRLF